MNKGWSGHRGVNNGFVAFFATDNAPSSSRQAMGQSISVKPHTRYVISAWVRSGFDHSFLAARTDCSSSGVSLGEVVFGPLNPAGNHHYDYRAIEIDTANNTAMVLCAGVEIQAVRTDDQWTQIDDFLVTEAHSR